MLIGLPFEISFGGFINFFLGMVTGVVFFLAFLTFFFFRGKKVDLEKIKRPENEVDQDMIVKLIVNRQQLLKKNIRYSDESATKLTTQISYELIEEISRYFFPNSKYPMLELSVHELLDLTRYISERVEELLDKPVLRNMKNIRVIQVVKLYERKKYLTDSGIGRAVKKYKVGRVLKYGGMVLNAVNPVYWFRKLVINTSIDAMTRKLCAVVVGIVGEETTKVYSKKLFDKPIELSVVEESMQELLDEAEGKESSEDTL
jgi:hypothetical protein